MKRWMLKLAAFLLMGAIVNVAVAWGCTLWAQLEDTLIEVAVDAEIDWASERAIDGIPVFDVRQPAKRQWHWNRSGLGLDVLLMDKPGEGSEGNVAAGFPKRSLVYTSFANRVGVRSTQNAIHVPDYFPVSGKRMRFVPCRPIWPGFAINTVFYAVILWVLFAAPFALRRRRRIKRGLCPACAYPVGRSDNCTECGGKVEAQPHL